MSEPPLCPPLATNMTYIDADVFFCFFSDRLRSGNVALSHLYCAAFTYHAVEKDFVDPEADLEMGELGSSVDPSLSPIKEEASE